MNQAQQTTLDGSMRAGTGQYNTPLEVVRPIAEALGGFDADVCASRDSDLADHNQRCSGGLELDWNQFDTVWCNHPYERGEPPEWLAKAAGTDASTTVVTLSRGDPSTDWFQTYLTQADLLCFPDRIRFVNEARTADFANVFGVFGPYPDALVDVFDEFGWVVENPDSADWSIAYLGQWDLLEVTLETEMPGTPSGVSSPVTVKPVTAKIDDGQLQVLTIAEDETWVLIAQNPTDVDDGRIHAAVDTGRGFQAVPLVDVDPVDDSPAESAGGVRALDRPADAPLNALERYVPG